MVVGATETSPASPETSKMVKAAQCMSDLVCSLVKPGFSSRDLRGALETAASDCGVRLMSGIVSHAVEKDILDGERTFFLAPTEEQKRSGPAKMGDIEFTAGDVFVVDIAITSSLTSGITKVARGGSIRPTIFKRATNAPAYSLKLKASRAVFGDIENRFGGMAFHISSLAQNLSGESVGVTRTRMALSECISHRLVDAYEVLAEADSNALVARVSFTIALTPKKTLKLTSGPAIP